MIFVRLPDGGLIAYRWEVYFSVHKEGRMDRSTNMTSGSPLRLILAFSFPLILTNLGQQMYSVVDAIIVGRGIGVEAFAALGASLLAQLAAFVYCFTVIRRSKVFVLEKEDWRPEGQVIREQCRLGIPMALQAFITVLGGVIAQSVVNSYGYIIVAAFLPTAYLMHVYRGSLQGLGNSFAPMVSGGVEFAARVGSAVLLTKVIGTTRIFLMDGLAWLSAWSFLMICYYITFRQKYMRQENT